jgi:NADPH-dependent 2,4-dienoyl-CoA reductase/sulfur reductase-like enzyme
MTLRRLALADIADDWDLVVVGAGPAGMAAAAAVAERGARVLVVDREPTEGGRIFQGAIDAPVRRAAVVGASRDDGLAVIAAFRAAPLAHLAAAEVWWLDESGRVGVRTEAGARILSARHVVIATGAIERPMAIPGWTDPRVSAAGAGQILLKSAGLVPRGRTVLAGTGPLLWLVAAQWLRAGHAPVRIVDTTPIVNLADAATALPGFVASPYCIDGAKLVAEVVRRVPIAVAARDLAVESDGEARVLTWRGGGRQRRVAFDRLFLHHGVVPDIALARAAGLAIAWNDERAAFEPEADAYGVSSVPTISVVGDGAAIVGAAAAGHAGRIAGLEAARRLGAIGVAERDRLAAPSLVARRRALAGRRFLDRMFRPSPEARCGAPGAHVCRCEEVTSDDIARIVAATGARHPDQIKAFTRAGMGACRGRLCAGLVAETTARLIGEPVGAVGLPRSRPPTADVTLGDLAALADEADGATAWGQSA